MLVKVYVENIHPEIVEVSDDYDFIIKKSFEDFTEEEIEKAKIFRSTLCDIMGISEKDNIEIDFEASRAGVEKKIDTAIKDWFCYGESEEDCKILRNDTVDELFEACCLSEDEAWDLINWLRIHCD